MKTTKIIIKNLFGIKETTLDGRSVEITGPKGSGKTSVLDAIRFALTNRSDRDYIIHQGADEGEIIIETDTGLTIDRKTRATRADTIKVKDGAMLQTRPAEFLSGIFTPLQLNPVQFTQLSRQEKNRVILNLIEFSWDLNWIREQFGEIPQGVDYSKHILEVLADIQAENGVYFQSRQNLNRDIRNKQAFIADIAKDIPAGYDYEKWNTYPVGEKYRELERLREQNNVIERAKTFRSGYESKIRAMLQTRPAEFLSGIFTPLQLNPVQFTQLSRQEKNRVILNLIEFSWDLNWIREQFGEIPQGVDYSKHILEVLADIQAENGVYFQSRQNLNRDIRNKQAFIADIAKDIPAGYDYEKWNTYPVGEKYRELERLREQNNVIERAKTFRSGYESKIRGMEAQRDMELAAIDREISSQRTALTGTIERLRAEIKAAEDKMAGLEQRRQERFSVAQANYEAAAAKLEKDMGVANDYADRQPADTSALAVEVDTAEQMRKHLNEYQRMVDMQKEVEDLSAHSVALTEKIELARELPARILETATIPVDGLTVENGIPLIHGLPISNLSDGELLELCVDITVSKPGQLGIILVDGAERLDQGSRDRLYAKCKAKGLQLIATRVTDSDELEVTEL